MTKQTLKEQNMTVIKHNKSVVPYHRDSLLNMLDPAIGNLNVKHNDILDIVSLYLTDGITTDELQEILITSTISLIDYDCPDAELVAGRLVILNLYRNYRHKLKELDICHGNDVYNKFTLEDALLSLKRTLKLDLRKFDLKKLNDVIDPSKDMVFKYVGAKELLLKWTNKTKFDLPELPQYLWMRCAMASAQRFENPTEKAIEFYNSISKIKFLPSTPNAKNAGFLDGNCFSCAVNSIPDTLEGIFKAYSDHAAGSKAGSGWGVDWSRVGALGRKIKDTLGAGGGKVPFLKIENDIAIAVDQLGTRKGAIATGIAVWDLDIIDFINMKRNGAKDDRSAKELFLVLIADDVFMSRVEDDLEWTLFDPNDVQILNETYGDEFKNNYLKLEKQFRTNPESFTNTPKTVMAKDIWKQFQSMAGRVGNPFIMFKDTTNRAFKPNYNKVGLIRTPNLCTEYLSPIKDKETPLCDLGSVIVPNVPEEEIEYISYLATEFLDGIIDITDYPIDGSEELQKERRSIGLGICGEGERAATLGLHYGSEEHLSNIKSYYALYAKGSDDASRDMRKKQGRDLSGYSDGSEEFNNLHRRCIAPNSTLANIAGTTQSIGATYGKKWEEELLGGMFTRLAPNLNTSTIKYYIDAFTICQKKLIDVVAEVQEHVDMGISFNIHLDPNNPRNTGKYIFDTYLYAWKKGLKTVYYVKTKSSKLNEPVKTGSDILCEGCD